ncbi:MAG: pseudouridine-5'-phosphate glycosidase, partial [Acidimicrobiaceae bacterium]|nr:pseudouridine-5'-phosphate glycosidase [Acidimicrobiaceae bacterium]
MSDEVRDAVAAKHPIVALESTIFTHGLPRPRNLEVACEAERQLRHAGVIPATVGLIAGTPTVGLSEADIELLSKDDSAVKVSTRDLPIAIAKGLNGGTTVAATSFLARRAGIAVFATGGIGGVHHGASTTFDESADLLSLASTPIVVVSAGVKSILDIPATLERLETLNVPVVGYRTRSFPGFYVADSGHRIQYSVESAHEVALVARARDAIGVTSALLVANPVPIEHQLDPAWHEELIRDAGRA